MRFFFTLLLLVFLNDLFSQNDSLKKVKLDSLKISLKIDSLRLYRFNKIRPYANVDNRNSFITKKPANVKGGQIGTIINEYHVFGFGFYTITQESQKAVKTTDNANNNIDKSLKINYGTIFYQFVMIDKRFFEIDLPFEMGLGRYTLKFKDVATSQIFKNESASLVPLGAGIQLVLKPVRWIGFSTTGGYRYVGVNSQDLNFNGLYYSFGLWLDIRQVYRDIKYYGFIKRKYKEHVNRIQENQSQ